MCLNKSKNAKTYSPSKSNKLNKLSTNALSLLCRFACRSIMLEKMLYAGDLFCNGGLSGSKTNSVTIKNDIQSPNKTYYWTEIMIMYQSKNTN